jgi:hypothetical protein
MFDWGNTDATKIKYIANGEGTHPATGNSYRIAYASARRAMSLASWRTLFSNSHVEGIVDLNEDAEYQFDREQLTEPDAIRASGCPPNQGIKPASKKRKSHRSRRDGEQAEEEERGVGGERDPLDLPSPGLPLCRSFLTRCGEAS